MTRALIIVDVQPTFCEGGALPVTGGNAVAEAVAAYVEAHRGDYQLIVTTQDWHIDPGAHFSETPDFVDTWPPHGVAGTDEAELHPALANVNADVTVKKGQYEAAYSLRGNDRGWQDAGGGAARRRRHRGGCRGPGRVALRGVHGRGRCPRRVPDARPA